VTRRLLAVHAHPDDESITMGGTLAAAAASGIAVTLVTCTLGEEGEVIGADAAGLVAAEADQLGGFRRWELRQACEELRIDDHRLLGGAGRYRDSGMAGTPSADHPRAFARAAAGGPDHEAAVGDLLQVMAQVRPDVVLGYDADGGYGHPDHIAAHQVMREAARRRGVPRVLAVVRPRGAMAAAVSALPVPADLRSPTEGDLGFEIEDEAVDVAVPVRWWAPVRRAALAAHATQIRVIEGGFALSNGIAQPVLDTEYFRLVDGIPLPRTADGGRAADLFAGLE